MPTEKISERWRAPFVWHVRDIDFCFPPEELRGQMRRRADAGGSIVDGTRLRACERDELPKRFRRHAGMHDKNEWHRGKARDRREVARAVRDFAEQRRNDQRSTAYIQGVAI